MQFAYVKCGDIDHRVKYILLKANGTRHVLHEQLVWNQQGQTIRYVVNFKGLFEIGDRLLVAVAQTNGYNNKDTTAFYGLEYARFSNYRPENVHQYTTGIKLEAINY